MPNEKQCPSVVVKTCGVQTVEAAAAATEAGADVVGVIFAPSGRVIDVARAQEIARAIRVTQKGMGSNEMVEDHASDNSSEAPMLTSDLHERISRDSTTNEYFSKCYQHIFGQTRRRPLLAGVFQNQDVEYIISVARSVPLDLVQLHGSEPLDMARNIPVPVIKVFHVDDQFSLDSNSDMFQTFYHSIILLDTKVGGTDQQGGKGVSFDWSIARQVADKGVPFMMAGGLTAENVAQAVAVGQPWGVDVSSGIETNKTKDPTKIRAFVNNAKCG